VVITINRLHTETSVFLGATKTTCPSSAIHWWSFLENFKGRTTASVQFFYHLQNP